MPKKITNALKIKVIEEHVKGVSTISLAEKYGVSWSSVKSWCLKYKLSDGDYSKILLKKDSEKEEKDRQRLLKKPDPLEGKQGMMIVRGIRKVNQAKEIFQSFKEGLTVNISYRKDGRNHDESKIHKAKIIQVTPGMITVQDINRNYRRQGITFAEVLSKSVLLEVC